jgi:hypothetical protein
MATEIERKLLAREQVKQGITPIIGPGDAEA